MDVLITFRFHDVDLGDEESAEALTERLADLGRAFELVLREGNQKAVYLKPSSRDEHEKTIAKANATTITYEESEEG